MFVRTCLKEAEMNRNGMGPNNEGPMTGRGNGFCSDNSSYRNCRGTFGRGRGFGQTCGQGYNFGRGFRRAFLDEEIEAFIGGSNATIYKKKEILSEKKKYYEEKLAEIEKELEKI